MYAVEVVGMVGAVLMAMGVLGYAWYLLVALKRSTHNKLIEMSRDRNEGGRCRGSKKNRYRLSEGGMHYGDNIVGSDESPTTLVTPKQEEYEYSFPWNHIDKTDGGKGGKPCEVLPGSNNGKVPPHYIEQPSNTTGPEVSIDGPPPTNNGKVLPHYIRNVIDLDMRPRIQTLETNAALADTQRFDMACNAEERLRSLVKNEGNMITILEKMTTRMLGWDGRLDEIEDKLRDSIFILYGGKKPDVE